MVAIASSPDKNATGCDVGGNGASAGESFASLGGAPHARSPITITIVTHQRIIECFMVKTFRYNGEANNADSSAACHTAPVITSFPTLLVRSTRSRLIGFVSVRRWRWVSRSVPRHA